jgi:hypothetical protein
MADDKKKRGGADRGLIALSEPYEVAYWSKKFKITSAKLKSAVSRKRTLREERRSLHQAAEAQGLRQGTDRGQSALRGRLLVEEIQGHPRPD